jgi:hypothetical protein
MVFGYFGNIFYIALLFTNAIAILNEERFLAKSELLIGFGRLSWIPYSPPALTY